MRATLVLLAVVALAAGSCRKPAKPAAPAPSVVGAPSAREAVLGTWRSPTGGTMEFRPDGTLVKTGPNGSGEVRYRFTDDRTIEDTKPGGANSLQWHVQSVGPWELSVTAPGGPATFQRVR